jgi:hypothetical protein
MSIDLTRLRGVFGRRVNLHQQAQAFKRIFLSKDGQQVILPALADICGVGLPAPAQPDLFVQGRHAGRQDVWLFIQQHIQLPPEEIYSLLKGDLAIKQEDWTHG